MKKTLIASAIAAVAFSGAAVAQQEPDAAGLSATELAARMESWPTIYGNIQLAVTYKDEENVGSGVNHFDNGSTIGIRHEHEIMPGLTAFGKIELEGINTDNKNADNDDAGLNELDEAYIGLEGDFGRVWVGSDDSQYEVLIDAIEEYYEVAVQNIGANFETGEGDLIQYTSPSFGGLTVHTAVAVQGDDDAEYHGKAYPYQIGVKYEVDMFSVAVAMDSNDGEAVAYDSNGNAVAPVSSNENTYGINVAVNPMDSLLVGALYSQREASGLDDGQKLFGVYGRYDLGVNTFAASYEMAEADRGDGEASNITLQALHNLSDNLYVYVEGYHHNDDNGTDDADTDVLALGGAYLF